MTEERYKKIENILNNIKYTRKTPPPKNAYFEMNTKDGSSLYSKGVSIRSRLELIRYLKKKYADILNQEILYILVDYETNSIIIYNINMEETKIVVPFSRFWCAPDSDNWSYVEWDDFFSDKTNLDLSFCNGRKRLYISPDKLRGAIKNAKIKMLESDEKVYLSFGIPSKELSTTLEFSTYINIDSPELTEMLSDDEKYIEQKKKVERKHFCIKFNKLYSRYSDMFDAYDLLSNEDKLKLKLTGKLGDEPNDD